MPKYYKYKGSVFSVSGSYPLKLNGFPNGTSTCGNFQSVPQPRASSVITNDGRASVVLKGTPPHGHPPFLNADYFVGEVPTSQKVVNIDYVRRPRRSMKEFNDLRKDGTIVLTPYERCTISSVRIPGATPLGPVVPFSAQSDSMQISGEQNFGFYPCLPPAWGYMMNNCGGVPLDTPVLAAAALQSTRVNRQYDMFDVDALQIPPDISNTLSSLLLAEIQRKEWDQGLITGAIAEANNGIYDLLTELGEARETIGFLLSALSDLVKIIVRTKRDLVRLNTNRKANIRFDEDLASLWLAFRYAVSPIGYSINDGLDLLNSQFSAYQTVRRGVSYDTEPVIFDGWTIPSLKIIDRVFVKYRFSGDATLHNIKFDPFATAWELTPLSFVVDWFLNVGDLITSLSVPANVQQQATSYSRQLKEQSFPVYHDMQPGHFNFEAAFYSYLPFSPLCHIGLSFDVNLTWKRWLDALALTWTGTKRTLWSKNP